MIGSGMSTLLARGGLKQRVDELVDPDRLGAITGIKAIIPTIKVTIAVLAEV